MNPVTCFGEISTSSLYQCTDSIKAVDETKLIRLFSDLTGEPEAAGRSVVMYIDLLTPEYARDTESWSGEQSDSGLSMNQAPYILNDEP